MQLRLFDALSSKTVCKETSGEHEDDCNICVMFEASYNARRLVFIHSRYNTNQTINEKTIA